ncbi:transporter, major facilitator family protein [Gleimia coleocanis DSM 15436]|uniref:Transporter, major facilitator family protein n=1 Tax=Gleimia coleocanis DSM 15436 TaxID=525245 RepID=C0VYL8_9ACTO|nr:MFS transporter [Gleimia coleocanis]EEH64521.1 transporter, major facilitator family protein [Gleimia coleocanis DSM 15436]
MSRTFQSFSIFNFRLVFTAAIFSATGMWFQVFAQDWLVLTELTNHDMAQVGYITAVQFTPQLLFAPWAGVVADRVNRRRMLQCCQITGGVLAATMGTLIVTGMIHLWHVYLLAFLLGTLGSFEGPARMSFVSEVVPRKNLPNAVGLNSVAFHSARMIGPATAGIIIDATGTGWVFIVASFLYLIPPTAFAFMRREELLPRQRIQKEKGQIKEAIAYVKQRPEIQMVLLVAAVVAGLGLNLQMTSAFMATDVYNKAASEYGIFGTFIAIGGVSGALLAARRTTPRLRTVIMAAGLFGVAETILALAPSFTTFVLIAIPVGLFSLTFITSANVYVQLAAEEHIRGRVLALYGMIFLGVSPLCSPLIGWIAEHVGARWSILVGSLSCILIAVVVASWAYRYRLSQGIKPELFEILKRPRLRRR